MAGLLALLLGACESSDDDAGSADAEDASGPKPSLDAADLDSGATLAPDAATTCDVMTPLLEPEAGSCPAGYFLYDDIACDYPDLDDAGVWLNEDSCGQVGDLKCHETCTGHADCTDPCRPFCIAQDLFLSGDNYSNGCVQICASKSRGLEVCFE